MNEKKDISNGDKLLELEKLNKAKYNILTIIKENELNNKFDTKENYQMIDLYKYVSCKYNSKLYSFSYDEKYELLVLFRALNEKSANCNNIFDMIKLNDKSIILTKTLYDIGGIEFHLFDNRKHVNTIAQQIMNLVRQDEDNENDNYDIEKVDDYMFFDFTNMFYDKLDEELNESIEHDKIIELTNLKYNYLYLFENVENRAILTNFNMPDYPKVASNIEIETTGLSLDDYLDKFDSNLATLLETHLRNILYLSTKMKIKKLDTLNRVFFKTCIALLADKELINSLYIDINNFQIKDKENISTVIEEINSIFTKEQEKEDSIIKYRRYNSI